MIHAHSFDDSKAPIDGDRPSDDLSSNSLPPIHNDDDQEFDVTSRDERLRTALKARTQSQGMLHLDEATVFHELTKGESCTGFCTETGNFIVTQDGLSAGSQRITIRNMWDRGAQGEASTLGEIQVQPTYAEILQVRVLSNGSVLVVEGTAVQPGGQMPPYAKYKTRIRLFEADALHDYKEVQSIDSKTYAANVLVSEDNRSVYIKGKRLAQMWQGWRGYDGSAVIEERYFSMPSYKGTMLKNESYKLSIDDPSFHTALCESHDRSYLLSGALGGLELISRSSKTSLTLDASDFHSVLPNDARIHQLSLSPRGDALALSFSRKGDPSGELHVWTMGVQQDATVVSLENIQKHEVLSSTPDYLGFTPRGALIVSANGQTQVRGGHDYQTIAGSIQAQAVGIDMQGRLLCEKDSVLLGYELLG